MDVGSFVFLFYQPQEVEKQGKVRSIFELLSNTQQSYGSVFPQTSYHFLANSICIFKPLQHVLFINYSKKVNAFSEQFFFILPDIIRSHASDLTDLNYSLSANQVSNDNLLIGDSTVTLVIDITDNQGDTIDGFYPSVFKFYEGLVMKLLIDPIHSPSETPALCDHISEIFPITFDKAIKLEYHEFVLDDSVNCNEAIDAVQFCLDVSELKSPMGQYMYKNLSTLILQLLSISVSNANSESVFSLVRCIKTDFRASLALSALIGCHFNRDCKCCEGVKYPDSILIAVKDVLQ